MNENIKLIAERIAGLRDIMEITPDEMAETLNISLEEYEEYERGEKDFSFSFLYTVADRHYGSADGRERKTVAVFLCQGGRRP